MRPTDSPVRTRLLAEHAHIEATLQTLLDASAAGADHRSVVEIWEGLSRDLQAHLRAEEQHLFGALRIHHPEEVAILEEQHAHLRTELDSMALRVELHTARAPVIRHLATLLRVHAAREGTLAYKWAETELPRPGLRGLMDRIVLALPAAARRFGPGEDQARPTERTRARSAG